MTRGSPLAAGLAGLALLAAACGGGGGNNASAATASTQSSAAAAPGATSAPNAGGTVLAVRADDDLGMILVDGQGQTCDGTCAAVWPPFTAPGNVRGSGVTASLVGTTTRTDGTKQVTYNGHPLYYYEGDSKPGDSTGQDLDQFGAEWYVVGVNGDKVDNG